MKASQLILCQQFIRLHATKYPGPPCTLSPHPTLLSVKHILSRWFDSLRALLAPPSNCMKMTPRFGENLISLKCNQHGSIKKGHFRAQRGIDICSPGRFSKATHFLLLPLWLSGCRAPWLWSANLFQVFSFPGQLPYQPASWTNEDIT